MGRIAGRRLAAAVSRAGGLGLVGAGYQDAGWIERELAAAGDAPEFTNRWHGHEDALEAAVSAEQDRYTRAVAAEDFDVAAVWAGEGIDLIHDVVPAASIVARLLEETEAAIARLS